MGIIDISWHLQPKLRRLFQDYFMLEKVFIPYFDYPVLRLTNLKKRGANVVGRQADRLQ